jgi:MYXO-CTERM domain-containing protein
MTQRRRFVRWTAAILAAGAFVTGVSMAEAGEITFTGNYAYLTGTGNGPIDGVLSLQDGSDEFEYGYSGWSPTSGVGGTLYDAVGGTAKESWSDNGTQVHKDANAGSGYYAQSVGTLAGAGINQTNLALVFQVNVAGQGDTMRIRTFDVVFLNADGTLAGLLTYSPDGHSLTGTTIDGLGQSTDNGILAGVGQGSSGWLYELDLNQVHGGSTAFNATTFFGNSNNRIGMRVQQFATQADTVSPWIGSDTGTNNYNFAPVNDGPDNFFFTTANATPIPLPSAAWMGLLGLAGIGTVRMRRRARSAL